MDKIDKALNKLNSKERSKLKEILLQINKGDLYGLDLKKLKARKDVFRVRKGNTRIIFRKTDKTIKILTVEHRGSKTYDKKHP